VPAILPESRLITLLAPYLGSHEPPANLYPQLSTYLNLLIKWNAHTNLTAIRDPETIVQRHFGESLFTGLQLATRLTAEASLLDFGSGAGFPGLPIQLLLPQLRVTLGESQNKKATFLREATRTLSLPHTEIWSYRIEEMPATTRFDVVTLRAVDRMELALEAARSRVATSGWLVTLAESPSAAAASNLLLPKPSHGYVALEQLP
jgi:16S rRNA (guanine527-N7)-methyltransferase